MELFLHTLLEAVSFGAILIGPMWLGEKWYYRRRRDGKYRDAD